MQSGRAEALQRARRACVQGRSGALTVHVDAPVVVLVVEVEQRLQLALPLLIQVGREGMLRQELRRARPLHDARQALPHPGPFAPDQLLE